MKFMHNFFTTPKLKFDKQQNTPGQVAVTAKNNYFLNQANNLDKYNSIARSSLTKVSREAGIKALNTLNPRYKILVIKRLIDFKNCRSRDSLFSSTIDEQNKILDDIQKILNESFSTIGYSSNHAYDSANTSKFIQIISLVRNSYIGIRKSPPTFKNYVKELIDNQPHLLDMHANPIELEKTFKEFLK